MATWWSVNRSGERVCALLLSLFFFGEREGEILRVRNVPHVATAAFAWGFATKEVRRDDLRDMRLIWILVVPAFLSSRIRDRFRRIDDSHQTRKKIHGRLFVSTTDDVKQEEDKPNQQVARPMATFWSPLSSYLLLQ